MQHDIFVHPMRRVRTSFPFIILLQSDYAESEPRLCAPLFPVNSGSTLRGVPVISMDGRFFAVALLRVFAVPRLMLRVPIASAASHRDAILRELDWLFTGL